MYKLFLLSISANYQKNDSDFFSDYLINENQIILNNFYLKEKNDNLSFNVVTQKFIDFISTTVKFSTNLSFSNYKNIVNNSTLRNNQSQNFNPIFSIKTGFQTKINFENEISYNYFSNTAENSNKIKNKSFTNSFKLKYNLTESIFFDVSGDYYLPNTQDVKNDYLFVDFNLFYKPISKKYELVFLAKNILNNKNFTQIQTNDFSRSALINNLVPRYVLLNLTYNL